MNPITRYATPVRLDPLLFGVRTLKQIRHPKSKRRRVRNKWSKNPDNWGWVEAPAMATQGGTVILNREAWQMLDGGYSLNDIAMASRCMDDEHDLPPFTPPTDPTAMGCKQ